MIQHFILTRSRYSDEALAKRRQVLTERYLLPSLANQTRKDFIWLTCGRDRQSCGWQAIEAEVQPETTHVLTTRVDDDDEIAPDFVQRLRDEVVEGPLSVYVFPQGHNREPDGRLTPRVYKHNQFASLLSPVKDRLTVYCDQHTHLHKRFPVVEVDQKPAWTWVRHQFQVSVMRKTCQH